MTYTQRLKIIQQAFDEGRPIYHVRLEGVKDVQLHRGLYTAAVRHGKDWDFRKYGDGQTVTVRPRKG